MHPRPTPPARLALLLALPLLAALALPAAQAGSPQNPEVTDPVDDVHCFASHQQVQCPGNDFLWNDVDIFHVWVNDTASDLLLTAEMKANPSFTKGVNFFGQPSGAAGQSAPGTVYDYTMTFSWHGVNKTATFNIDSEGRYSFGGAATNATVHHGNWLTFRVPKSALGDVRVGDEVGGLSFTAHGADQTGGSTFELLDRAPDANFGRAYIVGNGTLRPLGPFYATLTAANATVAIGAAAPTTATYNDNWTRGPASGTLVVTGRVQAGSARVQVLDAAGNTVVDRPASNGTATLAFVDARPGAWRIVSTLAGFAGNLTVAIAPQAQPSASSTAGPTTTITVAPPTVTSTTTASPTSKGSPGLGLPLLLAAVALALLARRR